MINGGGCTDSRVRLSKVALQKLADETGMTSHTGLRGRGRARRDCACYLDQASPGEAKTSATMIRAALGFARPLWRSYRWNASFWDCASVRRTPVHGCACLRFRFAATSHDKEFIHER
jgi:hypothetical protein